MSIKKPLLALAVLIMPSVSQAVIEDCTQGVMFSNGNTVIGISGLVSCVKRHEPTIKTRDVNFKDGKKHGKYIYYDGYRNSRNPQNRITSITHYQNDKEHGKAKHFNPETGELEREIDYVNGIAVRKMRINSTDNSTTISFSRKHAMGDFGEDVGSLNYNVAGQLSSKSCPRQASGIAELDKVCGFGQDKQVTQLHDANGNVKSTVTTQQGKAQETREYYPSGKLWAIRKRGSQKFFYENGNPQEELIDGPNRSQKVTEYYENGKKKSYVYTLERELQEARAWYMNSKPEYVVLRQGNSERMSVKTYYGNGKTSEDYAYVPQDRYSRFFRNYYRSAKLVGRSRTFHENGKLWEDAHRNNKGEVTSALTYFENGKLKKTFKIHADNSRTLKVFDKNGKIEKNETYYSDGSLKE